VRFSICFSPREAAKVCRLLVRALVQAAEGQPVGQVINEVRHLAGRVGQRGPGAQLLHLRAQAGAGEHGLGPTATEDMQESMHAEGFAGGAAARQRREQRCGPECSSTSSEKARLWL